MQARAWGGLQAPRIALSIRIQSTGWRSTIRLPIPGILPPPPIPWLLPWMARFGLAAYSEAEVKKGIDSAGYLTSQANMAWQTEIQASGQIGRAHV